MNNEDNAKFWEDIYLADDTGWDLNGPTPVFEHLAESFDRGQVCIIGCGRGYDAVMFAKKGFDVTAVDFAPSAIRALKELIKQQAVNVNAVQQDIFSLVPEFHGSFDYIIEQTCFCAIHPSRRVEYEALVKGLLKPGGRIIGLWFPLDKDLNDGGPPYGTTIDEIKSVFNIGWEIEKEEFPDLSIKPRKNREKLIIFKKNN
jgi:SAM-dependent methyltransferase